MRARSSTAGGITASGGEPPSVLGRRYSTPARGGVEASSGSWLEDIESLLVQQIDQRDQRQTDERVRILAIQLRDQRDAERLGLGAGGAVVGLLAPQVTLDQSVVELP